MCRRYLLSEEDAAEIWATVRALNRDDGEDCAPPKTGEIAPTDVAPVAILQNEGLAVLPMRWGFPHWQKGGPIVNARAETALDKAMFRDSLLGRRAAIPASGFFEWRHEGGKVKEKYLFRLPGAKKMYFAGFYNYFDGPGTRAERRYMVLTTAANQSVEPYHDRMPVLLCAGEEADWVGDSAFWREAARRIPPMLEAVPAQPIQQQFLL